MQNQIFWLSVVTLVIGGVGALMAWPRLGVWAWWRRQHAAHQRRFAEDALKHLHTSTWRHLEPTLQSLAGALQISSAAATKLIQQMEAQGWVLSRAEALNLTPKGERLAIEVIRAHRLWERYLADEARMPLGEVHAEAERREHDRDPQAVQALDAALGYPAIDPHGDPIPTTAGRLAEAPTVPLTDWPLNTPARIVHLEDEPPIVFSQLWAEGLRPGRVVRVLEASAQHLVLSDGEQVCRLAPIVAANIFVTPDGVESQVGHTKPLTDLRPGQHATVRGLAPALQGFTRRRLLDLGLTPGVAITAELPSMFRNPVAYRVRGTLIALRREQAEQVLIESP